MGIWLRKAVAALLLAATSLAGVQLMFRSDSSLSAMLPMLTEAKKTGRMPDGAPIRTHYTGNALADDTLTGLVTFFTFLVDGKDPASHRFALWFLPQLAPLLVHMYWEAGRRRSPFARIPTVFALAMQLFTGGITLPLYFALSLLTSSPVPQRPRGDAIGRARALLPAVALGFLVPSAALFLAGARLPLDTKQLLAAAWQPFPLWVALAYNALRLLFPGARSAAGADATTRAALRWVRRAYTGAGALCALAHLGVLLAVARSARPADELLRVFVPHALLPRLRGAPLPDAAAERLATRQLFQYDWLCITAGALVFFGWSHAATARPGRREMGVGGWAARVGVLAVLGGPGAALAWAGYAREERVFALQRAKDAKKA
ncbi:hypothetical protein PsYK624_097760 [Phanerochaete sordida]|uniref:Uncharacterized protein n=1 Tax=Phanerochaete sordida TaxID=48140 RepID=A0A9P3GF44_9APHY|nr:hypothetical protein PsYK624_097760 [Phanerochaete sordida]